MLTTRSSWTPSVAMTLVVVISFSSFNVLNAKKTPSSTPVPVSRSLSVPEMGSGPVSPIVPGLAPGPLGPECPRFLLIAVDCIDYLTPGNNSSNPGAACCKEANHVLNGDGGGYCFCELLANPDSSLGPVSFTQASKLHNRCGISGSPAALCSPPVNPPSPPAPPAPPPSGASATSIGLFILAFSVALPLSLLSSHMFF